MLSPQSLKIEPKHLPIKIEYGYDIYINILYQDFLIIPSKFQNYLFYHDIEYQ